jgi:hypothetical protein
MKSEIIRCLKRYVAGAIFGYLCRPAHPLQAATAGPDRCRSFNAVWLPPMWIWCAWPWRRLRCSADDRLLQLRRRKHWRSCKPEQLSNQPDIAASKI